MDNKKDIFDEINEIVKDFKPKQEKEDNKLFMQGLEGIYIPPSHEYSFDELREEYSILSIRATACEMMRSIRDIPDEVILGWIKYANLHHGETLPDGRLVHGTAILMSLIYARMDIRGL